MSLKRFVYYNAVIGGWAALAVWLVAETLFLDSPLLGGVAEAALTGSLAGLGIGVALDVVSNISAGRWRIRLNRGLLAGSIVAAGGGLVGAFLYSELVGLPRSVGWTVLGLGIGAAEGLFEKSSIKLRNGLIGGGTGGFLGGMVFDAIAGMGSDLSGRAVGLVILGVAIGGLIGLTHVVLKEAWLTVVDGFRPGRQYILAQPVTVLGRGDHLPLPLLGYAGRDLESEHARIARQADGQYVIEDLGSRIGTSVNGQRIQGLAALKDGDLIKLGSNLIRFEHRVRTGERGEVRPGVLPPGKVRPDRNIPPPPPVPSCPPAPVASCSPAPVASCTPPPVPSSPPPPAGVLSPSFRQQTSHGPGVPGERTPSGRSEQDVRPRIPPPPPPPG